jgi:arylsulfatase A-like enzyme
MNDQRPNLTLDLISRSAAIGGVLGLLDFGLFELQGSVARIREYALYKPSLVGLSFLSTQLVWFSALGIVFLLSFLLLFRFIRRLSGERIYRRLPAIVAATLSLFTITLRIYKHSDFSLRIAAFVLCSTLLVAYVMFTTKRRPSHVKSPDAGSHPIHCRSVLLLFVMILISCAAPDLYSLILRLKPPPLGLGSVRPNVLLIVMDTVRADHLSCYGYGKPTSPNIDRVAADGMLFVNAFSTAPWTLPSHASMFTGLYPSQHGTTWSHQYLGDESFTIAERMSDVGYETVGFSENPFVGISYGLAQGFNEFHETWRSPLFVRALQRIAAQAFHVKNRLEYSKRTTGLLKRWLANHHQDQRPFFAFVNLMTAHHPRYPRRGHGSHEWRQEDLKKIEPVNLVPERFYLPQYRLTDRELSTMRDVYDSEISYLDQQLAVMTRYLAEHDSSDNTILILTSDHGENFGDHGFIEHQFCLYNSLIRVPLIIRFPSKITARIVEENVSTIALFKTILDLVENLPQVTPENFTEILSTKMTDNEPIFSEFSNAVKMLENVIGHEAPGFDYRPFDRDLKCVISGDDKFIWSSSGEYELYSLQDDFGETKNLAHSHGSRAHDLTEQLESWVLQHPLSAGTREGPEVDEGTRDALRPLGYEW